MTITVRILLAILFVEAAVVGAWNALSPETFYLYFPTVDLTPPFSEHYARDYGEVMLGIAVVLGIALVKPLAHFVFPAAVAYSMFSIPHFFYHLENMQNANVGQAILLTTGNAVVAVMGLLIIALTALRDRKAQRSTTSVSQFG